jgi:hypothetical protein
MLERGMCCGPLVFVELHLSGLVSIFLTEKINVICTGICTNSGQVNPMTII